MDGARHGPRQVGAQPLTAPARSGDRNGAGTPADALAAYAWTVELAVANSHLLVEYGDAFGLTPKS
jgi:hypothetical protein